MKISAASQFKRNQDVVAQWTEDTLVLLTLQAGNYYSLNLTGGKAWDYCDGERNAGEIIDLICEEYETERSVAQEDLLALFEELCEERLLTVL